MKRKTCVLVGVFIAFVSSLLVSASAYAIENDECMECHSDDTLARDESEGMKEDLYIDYNSFKYSVHNVNGITCIDCHSDIEELNWDNEVPHPTSLAVVDCDGCHEDEGEAYLDSVHKKAGGKGITIPCSLNGRTSFVLNATTRIIFMTGCRKKRHTSPLSNVRSAMHLNRRDIFH
jgi:hypothetical protein